MPEARNQRADVGIHARYGDTNDRLGGLFDRAPERLGKFADDRRAAARSIVTAE